MTKRKPKSEHKTPGRPTAYDKRFNRIARAFAMLGATDAQLADALGVTVTTLTNWKAQHPAFLAALKSGKDVADSKVVASLYERAVGYQHKAVKIVTVSQGANQGSVIEQVPYVERYPPDATSAIFWLKNRRPKEWRDKQEVEHSGTVSIADALAAARERAKRR